MLWLWALVGAYGGGAVLVWGAAYSCLRPRRARLPSWALASLIALVWLPWLIHYRRSGRREALAWIDEVEAELHSIGR